MENKGKHSHQNQKDQLNHIVLQKLIGYGGFGEVYKGTWKGQTVALKRLLAVHQKEKEDLMKILKEEADVLERAKNRHIIQFYCVDEYEGLPVLITDFADNGSLSKVLENEKLVLDWDTRWRFAEEIASGIDFLHKIEVIHRDLKSDNVLLTKTMEIKLCDFGLARVKENIASNSMFSTTNAAGTLPWMAPELFGSRPTFGIKSD